MTVIVEKDISPNGKKATMKYSVKNIIQDY